MQVILRIAWTFFSFFIFHIPTQAQAPTIKWWYNTNDFSAGQSAAKDFDGDGKLEVVFGCYRNDSCIHALNGEDGSLLWKYNASALNTHGCNDVAPIIYDTDNNGSQEVIVPSSCNPKTFCFNGATGSVKWTCNTKGSDSPPTIADVDNDGKPEVLHGEFGGYVICINAENGTKAWEIKVDGNSWIQTAPTIADLDNDGQLDFVVGAWNFNNLDSVYAFRGNNQARLWAYPIHDNMYHGTAVFDADMDGNLELVIGSYNDTLYCLNGEDGTLSWKYKSGGYVGSPASLGDIDDDGICDVVFVGGSKVTALSHTGQLKWTYTIPDFGQAFRGVALADITNDQYPEVIFGSSKGVLYALNGNSGTLTWSLNLAAHYGNSLYAIDHAPLVADFDNDGIKDVFVVGGYGIYGTNMSGNFGRAYMISTGVGNGPDLLMFQRDIWRQSALCSNPILTDVVAAKADEQNDVELFPNPATNLNVRLRIREIDKLRCVRLFSTEGVLINTLTGPYVSNLINLPCFREGTFFVECIFDGTIERKKVVVLTAED